MHHQRIPLLPYFVLSVSLCLGCQAGTDPAQSNPASETPAKSEMKAYIDPETGKLSTPPKDLQSQSPTDQTGAAQKESIELVEEPGPVSGTMVDLKGKFNRPLKAKVGPDGDVKTGH